MNYKVFLEPQEEEGYTAYVPTLPGCLSHGETIEKAMANITKANLTREEFRKLLE